MLFLRQSTASQEIQLGKFVDDTDGKTAETGLTIANTDIKLFKHGATSQASKNSGGATHIANGHYYAVLDATDTDTVGNLEVTVDVSGALSVRREYVVLEEAVYDAFYAASAVGIPSIPANWITAAGIADAAIDRATFAADTGLQSIRSNTAQAGASGTITLDASASATFHLYRSNVIYITGGTGAGQTRICTSYDGTTKIASIAPNWATNPDNTSTFAILPAGPVDVKMITTTTPTMSGAYVAADVVLISGDSTAANNLENAFDDTAGANRWTGIIDQGTAQSATGTTLVLRSAAAFADDELIGNYITITGGTTGVGQTRRIVDNVGSTDTVTVATWATTPTGTITYMIRPDTSELTSAERDAIATAQLDLAAGVETGLTLRQAMRLLSAASAGKLSGAATTTITIRNAVADSKDRITATVDSSGNRSAITVDLT